MSVPVLLQYRILYIYYTSKSAVGFMYFVTNAILQQRLVNGDSRPSAFLSSSIMQSCRSDNR